LADELELKAVVRDAQVLRRRLLASGGRLTYRGMMRDYRLDRSGVLASRDEVLRVRMFEGDGSSRAVVGWKGPVRRSAEGYKMREELEYTAVDGTAALAVFQALGYGVIQAIDRHVEVYVVAGATARVEWYPRMDVLLEVEGIPATIEAGVSASGIPRREFLSDSLPDFVARYEARAGQPAILAESDLHGAAPSWATI